MCLCLLAFLSDIMRQFEHPHIIRLVGVVPDEPTLIVMEYAALGEVKPKLPVSGLRNGALATSDVCRVVTFKYSIMSN